MRSSIRRVLRRFENAVAEYYHAENGRQSPDFRAAVKLEYKRAKAALIRKLELIPEPPAVACIVEGIRHGRMTGGGPRADQLPKTSELCPFTLGGASCGVMLTQDSPTCDKTFACCRDKFHNEKRYGGFILPLRCP